MRKGRRRNKYEISEEWYVVQISRDIQIRNWGSNIAIMKPSTWTIMIFKRDRVSI